MGAPSPLAEPLAWDLVANGYAEINFDSFAEFAADALALLQLKDDERLLDVACGPGSLTIQAARTASKVAALDFSASMLKQLEQRLHQAGLHNVEVHHGDGQALPFADHHFDVACSMFGLMFFPDRVRGFAELHRVLRPGGRAVVSSWHPMSTVPVMAELFAALAAELPQVPFGDGKGPLIDPDDLRREMSDAGFEVQIESRRHGFEAPSAEELVNQLLRSMAPLVLLEHRLGKEAFRPVVAGLRRRLEEAHPGPIEVQMSAWLALGTRPK